MLSQEIASAGEKYFVQFSSKQVYQLEDSFAADRVTLRQLTKFAGSGGGISLTFDAMLLGEPIFWDAATDTLTIKCTPPNLRGQLQYRLKGNNK